MDTTISLTRNLLMKTLNDRRYSLRTFRNLYQTTTCWKTYKQDGVRLSPHPIRAPVPCSSPQVLLVRLNHASWCSNLRWWSSAQLASPLVKILLNKLTSRSYRQMRPPNINSMAQLVTLVRSWRCTVLINVHLNQFKSRQVMSLALLAGLCHIVIWVITNPKSTIVLKFSES